MGCLTKQPPVTPSTSRNWGLKSYFGYPVSTQPTRQLGMVMTPLSEKQTKEEEFRIATRLRGGGWGCLGCCGNDAEQPELKPAPNTQETEATPPTSAAKVNSQEQSPTAPNQDTATTEAATNQTQVEAQVEPHGDGSSH